MERGTRHEGRGLACCIGLAAPHCPLDTARPSPQVLAAGIEANIPVTYGIGSQRGDKSTGCQFIGQSPVHSVSAACRQPTALGHPGPGGAATGVPAGPLGAASSPPPRGLAPTPDNSSPTGTSGHFHMELLLQGVAATWRPLRLG